MGFAGWLRGLQGWKEVALSLGALALALLAGLLVAQLVTRVLTGWARRTRFELDDLLTRYARRPIRAALPVAAALLVAPALRLPAAVSAPLHQGLALALIAAVAWAAINAVAVLREVLLRRYDLAAPDNLRARMAYTQIRVIERVIVAVIVLVAVSAMLMTFERIRQVGVSMLASAGIIGVIAGFAAQKSIATLFAGIQIAITQPIRIDDVVIVENEWGRIEEITLTYVVVRIWDLRRLVVPITYFMDRPFQNWTRVSADLLGTVFLYVDYTVSVEAVRAELHRLLEASPHWDGKVWGLQVTDAKERTVELRALMSAADSGTAWNLRCEVREKLLEFLRREHPESLPRLRAEVTTETAVSGGRDGADHPRAARSSSVHPLPGRS